IQSAPDDKLREPRPPGAQRHRCQLLQAQNSRAAPSLGRNSLWASGGTRLTALQGFADQRQPVVAEIHVDLVEEDGRRAEAAARYRLVGIGLELVLAPLLADRGEKSCGIDADAPADLSQHRILRNVLIVTPVGLEHRTRERHHLVAEPNAAAHRLDA